MSFDNQKVPASDKDFRLAGCLRGANKNEMFFIRNFLIGQMKKSETLAQLEAACEALDHAEKLNNDLS